MLSPLTTLGSHWLRSTLQQGTPTGFDHEQSYLDHLGFVASALGVPVAPDRWFSAAPEQGPPQRLVAERQMNALLTALVSLSGGKSAAPADSASLASTAGVTGDVALRLANEIAQRGSFDPTDASQMRQVLASVLPASLVIDDALSTTLAKLMSAFALALEGDQLMSLAAQGVMPDLARSLAAISTAMNNGTLDSPAVQSQLKSALDRIATNLDNQLADAVPVAYARVVVNPAGSQPGAWIDRNFDGRINESDKVGGQLVAADFGVGKNADPTANRVIVTWRRLPTATEAQVLSSFGANDRIVFDLDAADYANTMALTWAAADANAAMRKADLSLTASGHGAKARLGIGKLPAVDSTQGVTAAFGAITVLAAGNASGYVLSTAELTIGLGGKASDGTALSGKMAGPVRVQAAGVQAQATLTAISNAALEAGDLASAVTGIHGSAIATLQSGSLGDLRALRLSATSYAAQGSSEIRLVGNGGNVEVASQVSVLAAGDGSSATVSITTSTGSILLGTVSGSATTYGSISALARGGQSFSGELGTGARSSVTLTSTAGRISVGAVRVDADGDGSSAAVSLSAAQGLVQANGAVEVFAGGSDARAQFTATGYSKTVTEAAVRLAGPLDMLASGTGSQATVSLASAVGQLQLAGPVTMLVTGTRSAASIDLSAASGDIRISGDWLQHAIGYQSAAATAFNAATDATGHLVFAGRVDVSTAGNLASNRMTLDARTIGDVTVEGSLRIDAEANQLQAVPSLQVSLVSSKGNFSSGGLSVTAEGVRTVADVAVGSMSGTTSLLGDTLVVTSGLPNAQGVILGADSKATASVSGGTSIALPSQISVAADAANASATLNLTVKPLGQVTAGAPAALGQITIGSSGHDSESIVNLQTAGQNMADGLMAVLHADLLLRRSAQTAEDATRQSTSFITGANTRRIDIGGKLDMRADADAVNGIVSAVLNARSTEATQVHIAGGVSLAAAGYDSLVDLDVNIASAASAIGDVPAARFLVDHDFSIIASRAGDLVQRAYGARADVSVRGAGASVQIEGNWITQSDADFGIARSVITVNADGGPAGASHLGGDLRVLASALGSTASAVFAGTAGSSLAVDGSLDVGARGAGAVATFSTPAHAGVEGGIHVLADSGANSVAGAYASVRMTGPASLAPTVPVTIDAARVKDIAVLDLQLAQRGGVYEAGSSASAGRVYLTFGDLLPAVIDVQFDATGALPPGRTYIALGTRDRDIVSGQTEVLIDTMLTIKDFRGGVDLLRLTEAQSLGAGFQRFLSSDPSTLQGFIDEALARFANKPGYMIGYVANEGAHFLVYDFDGTGLTGLVKLVTPAGWEPLGLASWTVPDASIVSLGATQLTTTTEDTTGESVTQGKVAIVADAFVERIAGFTANSGAVNLGSLSVDASGYKSVATTRLTAAKNYGSATQNIVINGDVQLVASGLSASTSVNLRSGNELDMQKALSVIAAGDSASVAATISSKARFHVQDNLAIRSVGAGSVASLTMVSGEAFCIIAADKETLVEAQGYQSRASYTVAYGGKVSSGAALSVKATGAESRAESSYLVAGDIAVKSGGILVSATAFGSVADMSLESESTDASALVGGGIRINGQVVIEGVHGSATTTWTSRAVLTAQDGIVVRAAGVGGHAKLISPSLGDLDIGDILISAQAVSGSSGVELVSGLMETVTSFTANGNSVVLDTVVGKGDILIGQLEIHASGLQSGATAMLRAYGGNITTGEVSLVLDGNQSSVSLTADTGARGESITREAVTGRVLSAQDVLAGSGDISIGGDLSARVFGAGATDGSHAAQVRLSAIGGAVGVTGRVIGEVSGDSGRVDIRLSSATVNALGADKAGLSIGSDLLLTAGGTGSSATGMMALDYGTIEVAGNVRLLSAGDEAFTRLDIAKSRPDVIFGGQLSASAAGSRSESHVAVDVAASSTTAALPAIRVGQGLQALASGSASDASVRLATSHVGSLRIEGDALVQAGGSASTARLDMAGGIQSSFSPAGEQRLELQGRLQVHALAADASAAATFTAQTGQVRLGEIGMWSSGADADASGKGSEATLSVYAARGVVLGSLEVVASGNLSSAIVNIGSAQGDLTVNEGISLVAAGHQSRLDVRLSAASGSLSIAHDVHVGALGEGSLATLSMAQGSASTASVAGGMRVTADSGTNAAVGAVAHAELALGKLDTVGTDLSLGAMQLADRASASLQLNRAGGSVQLGGDDQAGTAELNLIGRYLVDDVSISFQGSAGKAVLGLRGQDVNATTASGIGLMEVDGFRGGQDVIRFYSENKAMTAVSSGQGTSEESFRADALSYFADTAVDKGLYARSIGSAMYVAYDYDGNGVDGIVVLDDVSLVQFREYLSTTGLG